MDWVEERSNREQRLGILGPELWSELRAAMVHAVESFQRLYEDRGLATIHTSYEDFLRVNFHPKQQNPKILQVNYNPANHIVTTGEGPESLQKTEFKMVPDGTAARLTTADGRYHSVEQASQYLLEQHLFRDKF